MSTFLVQTPCESKSLFILLVHYDAVGRMSPLIIDDVSFVLITTRNWWSQQRWWRWPTWSVPWTGGLGWVHRGSRRSSRQQLQQQAGCKNILVFLLKISFLSDTDGRLQKYISFFLKIFSSQKHKVDRQAAKYILVFAQDFFSGTEVSRTELVFNFSPLNKFLFPHRNRWVRCQTNC